MRQKASSRRHCGEYEVGKGRPPVSTRWKPGQSGNPKGRPKGAKNFATLWSEGLNQKVRIRENGRVRKITRAEGIVTQVLNQALKGDIKAAAVAFTKEPEIARSAKPIPKISSDMSAEEAVKVYLSLVSETSKGDER